MFLTRKSCKLSVATKLLLIHKYPFTVSDLKVSQACRCRNILLHRCIFTTTWSKYAEKSVYRNNLASHTNHETSITFSNVENPTNELLEKIIAGISSDIFQKNRVYKNELIKVINKIQELNFSTQRQGLLLIRCCTELLPDETASSRLDLVEQIWNVLKLHTTFKVDHYNELLKVYTANRKHIQVSTFIQNMEPVKPNIATYEQILKCLAEVGDINQSTEVISNMKANNLPANESVFNSLILCQGKAGNLDSVQDVLTMMKSLKLEETLETYTAIACAFAWNKKTDQVLEELAKAEGKGFQFQEVHIMEIVKTLADVHMYDIIPKVLKFLPEETLNKPSISSYMQSVSTLLVFQNHPLVALEIYKCLPLPAFGPKDDQGLHGRSLVRDCVKASISSNVIAVITQELMSSGRNPIALNNAAEAALQLGKVPLALDIFTRMKQQNMPIRPHYFWPILMLSSKSFGEKGIMNTLTSMVQMGVKPDYDTMIDFTLPCVSFTSPQKLMKKFTDTGLSISDVLTPMMETLLVSGQVRAASEICELFQGKVDVEKLLKPIIKGYILSKDLKSTVYILEDILKKPMDSNKDWIGRLLCLFMQNRLVRHDLTEFMNLVKAFKGSPLMISTVAAEYCISRLPDKYGSETVEAFRSALLDITDERLIDTTDMLTPVVPHPKHMTEESLRAHLIELDSKGMNTRGVLRKLLQKYCRENNLAQAREVVERCEKEGVVLSAGMKASIFDLHVKSGDIDNAELTLIDLNKNFPNFHIDEFKILDFATLLVNNKKISKAIELIKEQSKNRRIVCDRGITMNCWRLLDATAAHGTPADTTQMFELLTSLRYCLPSNTMLGPLIRVHLNNSNLQEAVKQFSHISNKYHKTPLKHELLCQILKQTGEVNAVSVYRDGGKSAGYNLANTVLNATRMVHGANDVTASHEISFTIRCADSLIDCLRVSWLIVITLRRIMFLGYHSEVFAGRILRHWNEREDDYQSALKLHTRMQELDIHPSQRFVRNICSLLSANKMQVPPELKILLDKQEKSVRF
ncbi:hypothetical protein ACJJTC_012720 [Scirpophaga incertulas]